MLVIYILWAVVAAFSIAVGLEPSSQWRKVVNFGNVDPLRRLGLVGGAVTSFFVIFLSFFYMVTSNAAVVLAAWFIVFVVTRVIIEVMGRKNTYLVKGDTEDVKAPPPAKQGILGKDFSKHKLSAATVDVMSPPVLPSVPVNGSDVAKEEVSERPEVAVPIGVSAETDVGDHIAPRGSEPKNGQGSKLSVLNQPQILEVGPPPGSDKEQAAAYNDVFKRLNPDDPK